MGSDPYHWASGSDCHHLCCGRNYFHRHNAWQIKVGGVTHGHSAQQIKVGGVTQCIHGHSAQQVKVGGVTQVYTSSHFSADQGGWGHT